MYHRNLGYKAFAKDRFCVTPLSIGPVFITAIISLFLYGCESNNNQKKSIFISKDNSEKIIEKSYEAMLGLSATQMVLNRYWGGQPITGLLFSRCDLGDLRADEIQSDEGEHNTFYYSNCKLYPNSWAGELFLNGGVDYFQENYTDLVEFRSVFFDRYSVSSSASEAYESLNGSLSVDFEERPSLKLVSSISLKQTTAATAWAYNGSITWEGGYIYQQLRSLNWEGFLFLDDFGTFRANLDSSYHIPNYLSDGVNRLYIDFGSFDFDNIYFELDINSDGIIEETGTVVL